MLGTDVDDTGGSGPGSYNVRGNVWHLDCCNPETDQAWGVFKSVFGWTNSATLGSVLSYVFYWVMVIVVLVYLKYKEASSFLLPASPHSHYDEQGRTKLFGRESAAGVRRRLLNEKRAERLAVDETPPVSRLASAGSLEELPR